MLSQRTAISIKKELCNLDFLVEVFSQPLYQKILVKGNIRSFSAIRDTLRDLSEKIDKNPDLTSLEPTDAERLKTILEIMDRLFGDTPTVAS